MLITTMTDEEVTIELRKDYYSLILSPNEDVKKLMERYDRLRKKLKIHKSKPYDIPFRLTSERMNKWILILKKSDDGKPYSISNIAVIPIVYYYTRLGLRCFTWEKYNRGMLVFNGHLFSRYNERVNLQIVEPEDIIEHFFLNNNLITAEYEQKDGKVLALGSCDNGLLLGEYHKNNIWLIHKTFITDHQARAKQTQFEKYLLQNFNEEIEQSLKKLRN